MFFFVLLIKLFIIIQPVYNKLTNEVNGIKLHADISAELNIPIKVPLSPLIYNKVNIRIPPNLNYSFLCFQGHSLYKKVVTSFFPYSKYGYENNASDSGIIKMISSTHGSSVSTYIGIDSNQSEVVEGWLIAVASKPLSPIPGGCCLTCALLIDPNIHINYDLMHTKIVFERASKYSQNTFDPPNCDASDKPDTYLLTYDIYYYYLESNDFTTNGFFNALSKMSNPYDIKKNGIWLKMFTGDQKLSLQVRTIIGHGIIFNIIVTDKSSGLFSSYVPAVTYGCKLLLSDNSECVRRSIFELILLIILAIFGIFLCFAGYKYYRVLLFTCGTLLFWMISDILIANLVVEIGFKDLIIISSLWSMLGGALLLFIHLFRKCIYITLLGINVVLGILLSSIVFYTPFGAMNLWFEINNFCIAFASISIFISLVMLFFPKVSCYFCSSLLGSYLVILLANYFLHSNLHFIIQNVILRLIDYKQGTIFLHPPYQEQEFMLSVVWSCLFLIGVVVQYCTTKKLQFNFHPKCAPIQKPLHKTISGNSSFNEQTSLLRNEQPAPRAYSGNENNFDSPPDYPHSSFSGSQPPVNPYWNEETSQPSYHPVKPFTQVV